MLQTKMKIEEEKRAIEINLEEYENCHADKKLPIDRINQYVENHGYDEWIENIATRYGEARWRKNDN